MTAGFEIVPTGGPVGAELRGLDLSEDPPGDTVFRILQAFAEHLVLIFRDQQLDLERQLEIAEWFGPRYLPDAEGQEDDHAAGPVATISNVAARGILGNGPLGCHSDLPYIAVPVMGSALYAIEVPPSGGETAWSNLYAAHDALDEALKAEIAGLSVCAINPKSGQLLRADGTGGMQYRDYELPVYPHPLVRTHPVTGRKSLFVSGTSFEVIGAESGDRARALLEELQDWVDQDRWYYTHSWRPGDLVIWDNRCTNHKRAAFAPEARRVMRRVVMAGTRPF